MEKLCEFCKSLRPIVYCKADAAHLCLFCDSKVHSANALFNRHPRTLVCESCKYHPAYLRCSDHRMFMCRGCDNSSHNVDSHHKKRVISCYIGCPSAEDLASLWGFNSKELENTTLSGMSVLDPETAGGSSGQQTKAFYKCEKPETTCYLMQQILDLKRHQSAKGSSSSSLMFSQEQNEILPSKYDGALKFEKNIDRHLQQWLGIGTDIQDGDTPQQDLNLEPFLLPFSQIDQLNPSSTVDNPLNGESFWQSKFPVQSCQLWSQNMQDLGVCEEQIFDDFNIPDVDLTFRNFEEIFGVEKDQSTVVHLDDKGMEGSCVTKDMSLDTTNHDQGIAIEGTSTTSSVCVNQSAHVDNNIFPSTLNRQSYSETSFSLSRLSAESSGTDCMNTGLSSVIVRDQHACHSLDMGSPKLESRENVVMRIKEKKKIRRYEKKVQYASWKPKVCAGKQVKGKFAIAKGYESDTAEATRSC